MWCHSLYLFGLPHVSPNTTTCTLCPKSWHSTKKTRILMDEKQFLNFIYKMSRKTKMFLKTAESSPWASMTEHEVILQIECFLFYIWNLQYWKIKSSSTFKHSSKFVVEFSSLDGRLEFICVSQHWKHPIITRRNPGTTDRLVDEDAIFRLRRLLHRHSLQAKYTGKAQTTYCYRSDPHWMFLRSHQPITAMVFLIVNTQ